jgi:hypothetical protein
MRHLRTLTAAADSSFKNFGSVEHWSGTMEPPTVRSAAKVTAPSVARDEVRGVNSGADFDPKKYRCRFGRRLRPARCPHPAL